MADDELKLVDEPEEAAKFESRDVVHESDAFSGRERRTGAERRTGMDRRTGMRWEPDKDNRRSGKDRRKSKDGEDIWERRDF